MVATGAARGAGTCAGSHDVNTILQVGCVMPGARQRTQERGVGPGDVKRGAGGRPRGRPGAGSLLAPSFETRVMAAIHSSLDASSLAWKHSIA
jgi:hypothetical protein